VKPQLNQLMQGPFWGPYCTLFRTLELVVGGLLLFCEICSQMPDQTTMLWLPRSMSASSRTPSRSSVPSASRTLILAVVLSCATAYICSAGQLPSYFQLLNLFSYVLCLECFGTVGWASRRASRQQKRCWHGCLSGVRCK